MNERPWYTLREVAEALHLRPRTTRRLLQPFRQRCHLARAGAHPRLVLWVPAFVVLELQRARGLAAMAVAAEPSPQPQPDRRPPLPRVARSRYLG